MEARIRQLQAHPRRTPSSSTTRPSAAPRPWPRGRSSPSATRATTRSSVPGRIDRGAPRRAQRRLARLTARPGPLGKSAGRRRRVRGPGRHAARRDRPGRQLTMVAADDAPSSPGTKNRGNDPRHSGQGLGRHLVHHATASPTCSSSTCTSSTRSRRRRPSTGCGWRAGRCAAPSSRSRPPTTTSRPPTSTSPSPTRSRARQLEVLDGQLRRVRHHAATRWATPNQGIVHVIGPEHGPDPAGHDDRLRRQPHLDPRRLRRARLRHRHVRGRARARHPDAPPAPAEDDGRRGRRRRCRPASPPRTSSSPIIGRLGTGGGIGHVIEYRGRAIRAAVDGGPDDGLQHVASRPAPAPG